MTKMIYDLKEYLKLGNIPRIPLLEGMYKEVINQITIDGLWLEFGVFKGESSTEILSHDKTKKQILYGFESFLGMEEDLTPNNPKGICSLDYRPVYHTNVCLIEGLVQNTLVPFLKEHLNEPIAFANLDMTYSPTYYTLKTLTEYKTLVKGSIIVIQQAIREEDKVIYDNNHKAFIEVAKEFNLKFKYIVCSEPNEPGLHIGIKIL